MTDVRDYFDERSVEWERLYEQDPRFSRRLKLITHTLGDLLRASRIKNALDVGCGTGLYSRWLAERGVRVTAIDVSHSMLEIARSLSTDAQNPRFIQTDITHFADSDQFDLVIALSVLEYVDYTRDVIRQLVSHVASGGYLVISVPNAKGLTRKLERLAFLIKKWSRNKIFKNRGEYLARQRNQYRKKELDKTLQSHGLRLEHHLFLNPVLRVGDKLSAALEKESWAALYLAVYRKP